MGQQEVIKRIGGIFHELIAQYEYFKLDEQHLNELELEVFTANINFLKDHAEILRKLNLQKNILSKSQPADMEERANETKIIGSGPVYFEPVVQQIKPVVAPVPVSPETENLPKDKTEINAQVEERSGTGVNLRSDSAADSYSYIRETEGITRNELILDKAGTAENKELVNNTPAPVIRDEPAGKVNDIPPARDSAVIQPDHTLPTLSVYADTPDLKKTDEHVLTLNERLAAKAKEQIKTSEQPEQPIQDIRAVINLNDKMLFVKDLFNGYTLAYSEAVEILNRFATFEEADRFLQGNYAAKNNWEGKKYTADKFYALVKRRYA